MRVLALPERTVLPPQLNASLTAAVRAHRATREESGAVATAAAEGGLTAEARAEAEAAGLMYALRAPLPLLGAAAAAALPTAAEALAAPADGNAFAVALAALLRAAGARFRVAYGCALPEGEGPAGELRPHATAEARAARAANAELQTGPPLRAGECTMWCEVRIGRGQQRLLSWAQRIYHGAREARTLHYRVDREGYTWLNLDWQDAAKVQAPGAPYRKYSEAASFHVEQGAVGRWESDSDEFVAPIGSLTVPSRAQREHM